MELIIVESPTKAKTIKKFLGSKYQVESSFGHIRDLPKSEMGIDIENGFEPRYIVPLKAKKVVSKLKAAAKKAEAVILASDEDREGEAIAWHLTAALGLEPETSQRIVFHEITKDAIAEALKNPRHLNMDLVDAQQARRVLDRLVGYELSPFLWKKVARGLSAGRVQSVAVRLIVEREREIQAFKSEEYWSLSAIFKKNFSAELAKVSGKALGKMGIKKEAEVQAIIDNLSGAKYEVLKLEHKELNKNPLPPFTTSTLQQAANRILGMSAKQTMTLAQKLYELGFITYMRTDSLNLSSKFLGEAQDYLAKNLGKQYALKDVRVFKNKSKNAQEAHEAIRPTEVFSDPESLKAKLDEGQYRLYRLIWQRALASQMPQAIMSSTTAEIEAIGQNKISHIFRASGQIIKFDGYLKVYPEKTSEELLPELKKGEELKLEKLDPKQHFTAPPARYSDAGLVKEMEKHGIGRPSTYAPTISTIIERNYVNRDEGKRLKPTDIAFVVIDLLVAHFPQIVDYKFTAQMEADLDEIALGQKDWQPLLAIFYQSFHANLENKYKEINKQDIMPEEESQEVCDKCGSKMIIKTGRYGKFLACSNFPDCRNIKSMGGPDGRGEKDENHKAMEEKYKGELCDKCGAPMAVKKGRFGLFLACSAYPKCKNIKNIVDKDKPVIKCPACGEGDIVKKFSRRGVFYACSEYPNCKNAYWDEPTGELCPDCGKLIVRTKKGQEKCSNQSCGYEK